MKCRRRGCRRPAECTSRYRLRLYDLSLGHDSFSNPVFSLRLLPNTTAEPARQQTISFARNIQEVSFFSFSLICCHFLSDKIVVFHLTCSKAIVNNIPVLSKGDISIAGSGVFCPGILQTGTRLKSAAVAPL